jgi:Fe-S oxidoreductase
MERIEIIDNAELGELLLDLKNVDKEIVELVEESEERQKTFESKTMIRQKIVDKMKPIVTELFDGKLEEFEQIANITLDEKSVINVKIVDELEQWIEEKRKSKTPTVAPAEVPDTNTETLAEKTD